MFLPSKKQINQSTPIYPGSHFTWGEATKNCTRLPTDLIINGRLILDSIRVEINIIETAKKLDKIRSVLGDRPIIINSWYRPKHINNSVGGSRYSRHQYGDGVDFRSNYLSPREIYKILESIHPTGGISRYYSFVHIDWRGSKARW